MFSKREDYQAMKDSHIGELEELALLVVVGLGTEAYGVAVQKGLEHDAHRRIALGAVYAALGRLERKGFLRSAVGEATPQRGGRRKRMFTATAQGLRALEHARRTRERLWRLADARQGSG